MGWVDGVIKRLPCVTLEQKTEIERVFSSALEDICQLRRSVPESIVTALEEGCMEANLIVESLKVAGVRAVIEEGR